VYQAATGEGLVDLGVEIVAVGADQKGKLPAQSAMDFASKEHHRIRLAGPLGVPEHAQFAEAVLALLHRLDPAIDAEKLMVTGDDLDQLARAVVEQDEVLEQVEKIALGADPFEQGLHVHHAWFILIETFPLVEVLIAAGERAHSSIHAVPQHDESV